MFKQIDFEQLQHDRKANFVSVVSILAAGFLLSIGSIYFWLSADPAEALVASVPGTDNRPPGLDPEEDATDLSGVFAAYAEAKGEPIPGEWRQFRGEGHDNIVQDGPALAGTWGGEGPEELWAVEVGEGYAAPVVLDGKVYLLDYDEEEHRDALRCFSLADGTELWRRSYKIDIKRNHGMSRTIPAINEKYIVTMGPRCHVVCLDTETGDFRWGIDLQEEYGTKEPLWYTGQCPIIEDGKAIIAPSGEEVLMMAVDCETGDIVWSAPNENGWKMSHSSVIPMTLHGKRMYVYCAQGGIAGVSAEGDDVGTILWQRNWGASVVAPSPVQVPENKILMVAGYGKGGMMLDITESGGAFDVETIWETTPKDGITCEQQTPIFYDGKMYSIMPKSAGGLKFEFVCYSTEGELLWSSGADNRFGDGPFLLADDKFYILDDEGVLTVLDATKDSFAKLSEHDVLEGLDAWGPIALAGTRMLVRDMNNLKCLDVGAES